MYQDAFVLKAFIGNQSTCLKILPQQIQAIVDLVVALPEKGSDFLDLLNVIVKVRTPFYTSQYLYIREIFNKRVSQIEFRITMVEVYYCY